MRKIVQLQFSTVSAGSSAFRLQEAFLRANLESTIVSLRADEPPRAGITYLGKKANLVAKLNNRLQASLAKKTIPEFGLFSYPLLGTNVARLKEVKAADVIYVHWVLNGFLNFNSFKQLAKLGKPIIVFMHDMWSFTGGCHYSFSCEKYKTKCHACQVFEEKKENDLSTKGFEKKLRLYSGFRNFYFVSPSKWLFNCAKEASLTRDKPIFYIPNILNTQFFKPLDKTAARKALGIGEEELVIAFGATAVNNPYKGWPYLQKALQELKKAGRVKNISVLIFGSGFSKEISDAIPFPAKFLGYLKDGEAIRMAYNAANVFVVPSMADNQPTTIMESLSCGTPVVGFNVGGIPDMISHKVNGYLAKYKDAKDIADGISFCLENGLKGSILPDFEPSLILQKHLDLFDFIKSNINS